MAKKFIINNGELILGDVKFHCDLIPYNSINNDVVGGGFWEITGDVIRFYGCSTEFGCTNIEEFENSHKPPSIDHLTAIFVPYEYY